MSIAIQVIFLFLCGNECFSGVGMNSWNDIEDSFPSQSVGNIIALIVLAVFFYNRPFWTSVFMAAVSGMAIMYNGGTTAAFLMLVIFWAAAIYIKTFEYKNKKK